MKLVRLAAVLPLVLAAFGCATTQSLSNADRKAIQAVSVSPTVAMPAYPIVAGPSVHRGAFFGGPIAMGIMMNSENDDVVAFKKLLAESKIDMGDIVKQEFVAQLSSAKVFPTVVAEGGQASFALAIVSYGLTAGFSMSPINKPLRPHLTVIGKLLAPDGKVLWESQGQLLSINSDLPAYQLADYLSSETRTREALTKTAERVVKEMLATFEAGS